MFHLTRPGQHVIGVDISDQILRAAVVKHERKALRVVAHAQTEMAEGAISRGVIQSEDDVVAALRQLMKYISRYRSHASVVAGLPEYHGFINTIAQTANSTKEEIEKHLPFPYNEVRISSRTTMVQRNNLTQKILSFGAVRNETAESYERLWNRVGVHIRAMEIESQALARLLYDPSVAAENAVVICDIGNTHTTFVLMQHGHIDFTFTSQHISGIQLTRAIAEQQNISFQDARVLKESLAENRSAGITPLVVSWTEKLIAELDRVVSFHKHHQLAEKSSGYSIILTGGGSLLPDLDQRIQRYTSIATMRANMHRILRLPRKFSDPFSYGTAIGLAMRRIDK